MPNLKPKSLELEEANGPLETEAPFYEKEKEDVDPKTVEELESKDDVPKNWKVLLLMLKHKDSLRLKF